MHGPLTRREVGDAAEVSPATVSNLVGELLEQGVLVEAGAEDSHGGRPRAFLDINPSYGYVVGVDVGETAVLVELFDLRLRVLASHASRPAMEGRLDPDRAVGQVLDGLAHVLTAAAVARERVLGVGIGVPGLVEPGDDALVHAPTVGWTAVPIGGLLRGGTDLPLHIDNGAKTLGQAEKWFGAARDCDDAVIALLGTGVGTSIILDGDLYRGRHSSAGEWGHTTVAVGGRLCRCGASGCLEAYIGARAVLARYEELSGRPSTDGQDLVSGVAAIATAGLQDEAATQVRAEIATFLGAGIADLVNLFNPERIVVGGWLGALFIDRLLPEVREQASRHALRLPFAQVQIVAAELGDDAVALGAATLPISRLLASGAALPLPSSPTADRRPTAAPAASRRGGAPTADHGPDTTRALLGQREPHARQDAPCTR